MGALRCRRTLQIQHTTTPTNLTPHTTTEAWKPTRRFCHHPPGGPTRQASMSQCCPLRYWTAWQAQQLPQPRCSFLRTNVLPLLPICVVGTPGRTMKTITSQQHASQKPEPKKDTNDNNNDDVVDVVMTKSKATMKQEQQEAQEKLESLMHRNKPKNLREGVGAGVNNILAGAIGGAGVAVVAPTMGLAAGLQSGGLVGGAVGVAGGAVVGVLGAAGLVVGGALSGVSQMVQGVAAVPQAVMAPRQGKWWNETTHQWVYTDLTTAHVPDIDDDILKHLESELETASAAAGAIAVKDTFYYDVLEVDPSAEASAIKRKYYQLARQYHPDRNKAKDAANKFKEIAEAYQVLSDPKLRQKYNRDGRDTSSGGSTTSIDDDEALDPSLLMAFLFGSDRFQNYFGRLATSTSAMLGDSSRLSVQEARILQERRVTRLALHLVAKIEPWIQNDLDLCKVQWKTEAEDLVLASYGWELIQALGMAYEVAAAQFLGSTESGIGMPSIQKWADGQHARAKERKTTNQTQWQTMIAGLDAVKIQLEYQEKMNKVQSDAERVALERELQEATQAAMLKMIWTTTVVDITSTIHEVCQMVFFDQSVDKVVRKKRAQAVQALGGIFLATPEPLSSQGRKKDARVLFEDAALAATVEMMKRKDEAAHGASFGSTSH